MMDYAIYKIINEMSVYLNTAQLQQLQKSLIKNLVEHAPDSDQAGNQIHENKEYLDLFLNAKKIEGLSEKTLKEYKRTINKLIDAVDVPFHKMTTDQIRQFLNEHQEKSGCSKASLDTTRRYLSGFFRWMMEEDYILRNPMNRIHKIKYAKKVKKVLTDEDIEKLRDHCKTIRDLAIIDMLYSTGMRISELVQLNIEDVDFEKRECIVFGKGSKERIAYFDAKTKVHLLDYLDSRDDENPALFVRLRKPHGRIKIGGVEKLMRELGQELHIQRVHPHKFRRTMATKAIDKGMPVEQVQKLLGHAEIDTTMEYAIVNQSNVKASHKKYMS